jgi:DnaJ-class molecular chaperone
MGVVKELGTKLCSITGKNVIEWEVTANLPVKFEKSKENKCPTCKGTGKVSTHQGKLI